ncbi:MAG: sorbosone dehydrogenase family protein [Flavisolibacter sp.]
MPVFCFLTLLGITFSAYGNSGGDKNPGKKLKVSDNTTLKLPKGFKSMVYAENLGRARHIVINKNGDLFVKLERLKDGKGIFRLRPGGAAKAMEMKGFGNYIGTGIAIKNGYLFATSNTTIYRYKLGNDGNVINPDKPETVVSGLTDKGEHNSKSIVLDNAGNIYVNVGAPSNSCQVEDRAKGSLGQDPCPILDYGGGIWQFKADKLNQSFKDGVHYATGIRNVVGLDWNTTVNELFVMQHGRDQLHDNFPELYTDSISAELPAEEFLEVKKGTNFGWPYCYYDQNQNKKILAPEYGGDGQKQDRCASVDKPIVAFPGHMAPDGLLFYTGKMFPDKYKNGAFIAFHGSWNRAPLMQKGFFVAFVPFVNGKPNGPWEIFANGFAGNDTVATPNQAAHRPVGLAQGNDGALYISDDSKGTIWKISYSGK